MLAQAPYITIGSRRLLWQAVASARAGKALVLTTHSMEEAEVFFDFYKNTLALTQTLCSKIAIMAKGKLKCIGSPLHLKNTFDHGYRLTINFDEKSSVAASHRITELITQARCYCYS